MNISPIKRAKYSFKRFDFCIISIYDLTFTIKYLKDQYNKLNNIIIFLLIKYKILNYPTLVLF